MSSMLTRVDQMCAKEMRLGALIHILQSADNTQQYVPPTRRTGMWSEMLLSGYLSDWCPLGDT